MAPLWIDYQRNDPARRRAGLLLLAFGVVVTLLTSADYFAVAAERDDLQAQVEGLRQTAERERPVSRTATASAAAEPAKVAPSAQRWDALFASLEAAADETVTLLTLHPTEKEIQLSGEARDFAASMDYVQRLQAQPALANARLTQSEVMADKPHRPVRFALVADWRGAR